MGIRIVRDMNECQRIWESVYPNDVLFDVWEVRACFARSFRREPYFIVSEDQRGIRGLIPLCTINETGSYGFFPGETWHHKTWIEQNKIVAMDGVCLKAMLECVPANTHIRYLDGLSGPVMGTDFCVDEIGYLFYPGDYGHSFDQYLRSIPGKSRKKILSETGKLKASGVSYRINESRDIDHVFTLNIKAFGDQSYFFDPRFLEGFRNLVQWLKDQGMLRVVTLLVNDNIAAVDIGAIYRNQCVLLAGGTSRDYPGVAKVINLHHLEWACKERMAALDFLCGDFGWKERFRLSRRPLYVLGGNQDKGRLNPPLGERVEDYAA